MVELRPEDPRYQYMAASHKPSMNLRFIIRDGKRILQQLYFPNNWQDHEEEWRDIPLIEESSGAKL